MSLTSLIDFSLILSSSFAFCLNVISVPFLDTLNQFLDSPSSVILVSLGLTCIIQGVGVTKGSLSLEGQMIEQCTLLADAK